MEEQFVLLKADISDLETCAKTLISCDDITAQFDDLTSLVRESMKRIRSIEETIGGERLKYLDVLNELIKRVNHIISCVANDRRDRGHKKIGKATMLVCNLWDDLIDLSANRKIRPIERAMDTSSYGKEICGDPINDISSETSQS
jgi:hypothetical protein